MSAVRNILQTVQERTIVKTAPDMVVYLDGLPYLANKYLDQSQSQTQPIYVNFNDYVTHIAGQCDVENLIPSVSISLSVPNDKKLLFMAPGGDHIIQAMMEVQIYSKGYFLSTNGNTLYRRIFKGLVSHAGYNDNGKTLEIALSCHGVLQFMENMQTDLNPAVMTNSPLGQTPLTSLQANMSPLNAIADMFTRSITTEGFQLTGIQQQTVAEGPYAAAIQAGYIAKWQKILDNIYDDLHIYGLPAQTANTSTTAQTFTKDNPQPDSGSTAPTNIPNSEDPKSKSAPVFGKQNEVDQFNSTLFDKIREWLPDMGIAPIPLLNGRIMSRMERLRNLISMTLYEGYQDLDGSIIIKPPLYNLDVVNVGTNSGTTQTGSSSTSTGSDSLPSSVDIYDQNNPFVINLDEIVTEQETEDQQGIRATRMSVRGSICNQWQYAGTEDFQYVSSYTDVKLLAQFGLREEPTKFLGFLPDGDHVMGFALAVFELVKANRSYRTYTCRIPLRPELKLGFPCYIPHRDMYAYLRNISYNYNVGGEATMDLSFDFVRRRPMYPTKTSNNNGASSNTQNQNNAIVYSDQPNLINRYVKVQKSDSPQATGSGAPNPVSSTSTPNTTNLTGQPATLPLANLTPNNQQIKVNGYYDTKLHSFVRTATDTSTQSWAIQQDSGSTGDITIEVAGKKVTASPPFFTKQVPCDGKYMSILQYAQPFTDDKGYELITPFPWGRWATLKTAINEFTRVGYVNPTSAADPLSNSTVNAFLFAGVGAPTGNNDASSQLSAALNTLSTQVGNSNNTVFELTYPAASTQQNDGSLLLAGSPDAASIAELKAGLTQRIQVFVTGVSQPVGNQDAALTLTAPPAGSPSISSSLQNISAALSG